jgi:phospholipid/cholesterol/gamma-HCH transport system substrate-binding protein|tara:strand:+ start:4882 stop:5796 length:915 start_codon:yes stop_codon:yes gene_type:complete
LRLSKEIKAAFFVLSTILLFIFGFNYLKGSSILDKQKTIYAVYDEVDGLLVGANVMINGLSIGNVTELDFLPNSTKIIVTLKVKDKLNFSSKSTASIYETGVLGGLAISIEPLFERESIVKTGDTLMSSVRPGLTELINRQIEPLSRQLQSTITSVDSIFTGASNVLNRQTQEEIKESISVLTSAINAINNSSLIIEETLISKNTQINNTIDNFEKISSNLSNVSDELNSFGLSSLLTNLQVSVDGIGSIVDKLDSDNSTLGKLINEDEVYNNLNSSIESLNILINDIKANPKKYVHFSVFGRK